MEKKILMIARCKTPVKMWLQLSSCIFAASLLLAPTMATVCPDGCICTTTRDGLHRATCSSLAELYKFTLRQKHHNINILDLSHNNITKLNHELDRLTEVVTLDLSTNGIQYLNKFLHNAKKLVHLNLANNRIQKLSLVHLPASVSSLDLTNNNLQNVPSNLEHLAGLEHLEMEGNPLHCSCENLLARDHLLIGNVLIDHVDCASPEELKGKSWLELKTKDICKVPKIKNIYSDMMMGDQPLDAVQVGAESTALKAMPLVARNDLEDGNVIQGKNAAEDDDSQQFLIVGGNTSPPLNFIEGSGSGSGDGESTTISDYLIEPKYKPRLHANLLEADEIIPVDNVHTTEDPSEGSGEGSGYQPIDYDVDHDVETTTEIFVELIPGPVERIFKDETNKSTTEFPLPEPPSVYQGGNNWNVESIPPKPTENVITSSTPRDTTISEQIRVTQASEVLSQLPASNENVTPHKTGTYVCIALIVVLLVGLIGFAIAKGQMRKRRDRRLLRQQKRDVENASKEMVDMNTSLLGKPAPIESPIERKSNGKYEQVPTHEVHQKKGGNGDISNGINHNEPNGVRTDSPRDSNQNKSTSKDNNLKDTVKSPKQETSFDSAPASRDSLSSEDIFVPINDDEPKLNGTADSDMSQPLMNGDQNTDSDFLSPSREYIPVYSPDMGRVRIKMAEIPKPKTPVLVTRSRSNAGEIIITPSENATRTTT
ncbi:Leucine-rich repeat-containing protein [Operophtera brumata]|uniref:Leucine-rich repeat-containing protein n=1 Tax=Operophtera brumata TaxID=104452 RepID=A0A0L7LFA2_OPEBR|nr:Leucine-rich repeat-containing protein [Operophtera brumata]